MRKVIAAVWIAYATMVGGAYWNAQLSGSGPIAAFGTMNCWYVDGSVNGRFAFGRSIDVTSDKPVHALGACLRAMAPVIPKKVVAETARG